jgi:hypothetical protein
MPLPDLDKLVEKPLAGFVIERWYRVVFDTDPGKVEHVEYYRDKTLAIAVGEKAGEDGRDLTPGGRYVLTLPGTNEGYIIGGDYARLSDEKKAVRTVRTRHQPAAHSAAVAEVLARKV